MSCTPATHAAIVAPRVAERRAPRPLLCFVHLRAGARSSEGAGAAHCSAPCNRLAELAEAQILEEQQKTQRAVPSFSDHRDVTMFTRQRGKLPAQRPEDKLDYRGLLHRDGS
eukprot:6698308-Prymnesium_polylepis.1